MRRLALLALVLAAVHAGTARADTFAIVPPAPFTLPDLVPNPSLAVPSSLSTPPAVPEQLAYPQLLALWQQAGAAYGIPWQVLAAINKVESNWGRNMGPSSAGAIGWMQFMPSTWLRWGVDASGDGIADPWNPADAIFSAARYLAAAGGTTDIYRGVFAYNHADWYVNEVLSLANLYGGNSGFALSLDGMQQNLDAARGDVAHTAELVTAAQKVARSESRVVDYWQARAAKAVADLFFAVLKNVVTCARVLDALCHEQHLDSQERPRPVVVLRRSLVQAASASHAARGRADHHHWHHPGDRADHAAQYQS